MDYVQHWGLTEKPFEEHACSRYFFESEDHREALDRLLYVVSDRNMSLGLLTGEIGSGKTMTAGVLAGSLSHHDYAVIHFENSTFPFEDLLYDMLRQLSFRDPELASEMSSLPERGDKYMLMTTLRQRLESLIYRDKRYLVAVFDEAQQMGTDTLDELRNLTNLTAGGETILTMFLVGQPELRQKVRQLKQLDQRIFLRFHLNNLDYNNTVKYVQHRLRVAGLERGGVFTNLAYDPLFRATGGVPREINRLCKLALTYGFAQGADEITPEDIEVILQDFNEHG